MASFGALKSKIYDREERKQQYQSHIRGLNAYDRHKKFLNDYVLFYGKEKSTNLKLPIKTDQDTLREGYRFIRSEEDDKDSSWEQRLVKRYYDKLFKEYCIADMSHYKSGKIGLRWRTEKEVVSGKGQFICGNKHCEEKDSLTSYEVNFSYVEAGENKQALVKLVTCGRCTEKLHYKRRKEREQLERQEKEAYKRKRDQSRSDCDIDEEYEESADRRKSSESREKKEHKKKREQPWSDHGTDEKYDRKGLARREKVDEWNRDGSASDGDLDKAHRSSKEKGKGRKASSSLAGKDNVDNDNFDEFLEGMFP